MEAVSKFNKARKRIRRCEVSAKGRVNRTSELFYNINIISYLASMRHSFRDLQTGLSSPHTLDSKYGCGLFSAGLCCSQMSGITFTSALLRAACLRRSSLTRAWKLWSCPNGTYFWIRPTCSTSPRMSTLRSLSWPWFQMVSVLNGLAPFMHAYHSISHQSCLYNHLSVLSF